ncbi:sigma-70 family RNA polymerase sigma factor [Alistipes finegoldii]|uniref:sigma-70 family RNA polymerase sigma factor n=1 Tax=Alistipes finegoldii TaxID=214856 RepID=UPI003AF12D2C
MNFIRNRNFKAGPQTSLEGFICPQNSDKKQKIKVFGRSEGGGNLPSRNEIEEKLDLAETAEQVETIVGKMPPQRQQIFRMSRFEHMPSREIAEQLNLSVRTVDKHLELALKELRKYLNIIPAIIVFLDILP